MKLLAIIRLFLTDLLFFFRRLIRQTLHERRFFARIALLVSKRYLTVKVTVKNEDVEKYTAFNRTRISSTSCAAGQRCCERLAYVVLAFHSACISPGIGYRQNASAHRIRISNVSPDCASFDTTCRIGDR